MLNHCFWNDMPNCMEISQNCVDIAIVGLGPGGMSAALEAAKLGLKVLAITQKRDYVRGQRFKPLSIPNTIGFLDSLENSTDPADTLFFEKLKADQSVQLKDLEKFLFKKLSNYPDLITVVELGSDNPITAVQYDEMAPYPYLSLLDNTRYYFRNLLGSDGAKRQVSQMVKEGLDLPVTYQDCSQPRHPYHASVQLFFKKTPSHSKRAGTEKELGWSERQLPESLILHNHARTKFSFVGEIPDSLFVTKDERQLDLLKNWAALQIAKEYGDLSLLNHLDYRQSKKYPQSKDKVKACTFTMNLSLCTEAVFPLAGGGYYAPIGDARRSPDYKKGHGIHDAMLAGIEFVRGIQNQDMNPYRATILAMDTELNAGDLYYAPFYTEVHSDSSNETLSKSTSGSIFGSTDSDASTISSEEVRADGISF